MKIVLYIICVVLFFILTVLISKIRELKNIQYKNPNFLSDKKILTVYYSNGGNTKSAAENLNLVAGGDIKEIKLIEKYPNNIFKMSKLVRKQIAEEYLPEIKNIDIVNYDIIFIGSPIWNFSMSLPIKAFLKNNNFENKTLIPFFTCSGGVNKNKIIKEIKGITNSAHIKKAIFLFENGIFLVKEQFIKWLNNI